MRRRVAAQIGALPCRWRSKGSTHGLNEPLFREIGFERVQDGTEYRTLLRRTD